MSHARILIVEDEAIVALELEHRLQRQGYVIAGTARSAEEALALVAVQPIDLALLDLRLGGKRDGIDVARELRERDTPFVFLTAHGDDETLARVKAVEPQGYLLKPFDERLLRLTIDTALHRYAAERARLAAERARRSAEAMQATILEYSPYGVLVVAEDGSILLCNRAAGRIFDLEHEPEHLVDLIPSVSNLLLFQGGLEPRIHRVEGRRRDGAPLPLECACGRVTLDEGERWILIVHDLSEQLRLEEQVVRARQLEVAGRVAAGIVHDLNNLLSVVWMSAFMMQQATPAELPLLHRDLDKGISLGANLTTRLLSIARRGRPEPRALAVNDALQSIAKLARRAIKPEVEIVLDLDARAGATWIDATHFDQLILNLALNSDRAMPEGGRLVLRSRRLDPEGLAIEVEDAGVGIDEAIRPRLFDPFFTTRGESGGTGLGLSIVKDIVDQVGGSIVVESAQPRGTRFRITLVRHGDACHDEPPPSPASVLEGRGRVVLIVDDDALHARALARLLEAKGFRTLRARGPGDALLVVERGPQRVSIAILDVEMPYMDGAELAERLWALDAGMRILLLSGTPSLLTCDPLRPAGCLRKPVEPELLFDELARLLGSTQEPP